MRILVCGELAETHKNRIAQACSDVSFVSPDEVDVDSIAVLLVWDGQPCATAALIREGDIGWVHLRNAGVPPAITEACSERAITLTNGSGAHAIALAEFALSSVLAHYQRLRMLCEAQRRARWLAEHRPAELFGRVACIVGAGSIGRRCASVLSPLGVKVIAVNRSGRPAPEFDAVYPWTELLTALGQADILIVAAPLTEETRGLISDGELGRLRMGAILINIGRGEIVSEAALLTALRTGGLGGAALDVFASEPLAADSPLWKLENVLISPHRADNTEPTEIRSVDLFVDNLLRRVRGQPLKNLIEV